MVSRVGSTALVPLRSGPTSLYASMGNRKCAKLPQLHPHMKHAWHPWNSKISSLLAWAIALWHLPAAARVGVMKMWWKVVMHISFTIVLSTCYAFIWDNYISLGRINTFWRGSKIHHIIHHAIYMYHIFMNHHLLQALVMLFGRTGNPIWVGILLWCCMFNYHTYQNMYLTLLHPCKIHRVLKFQQLDNSNFQPVPVP